MPSILTAHFSWACDPEHFLAAQHTLSRRPTDHYRPQRAHGNTQSGLNGYGHIKLNRLSPKRYGALQPSQRRLRVSLSATPHHPHTLGSDYDVYSKKHLSGLH